VMAISVFSVSLDSSEDSVGTPAGRVILFDYTPASPDYSPASDTEFDPSEDPSSDHIPPLPATSPFLSSTDDSSYSDIPDTPPSPTHGTPFTETTLSTQRSPTTFGALRRRVMVLAPGQPIPHGRPYRYHPNGPVHMMTTRKRVGPIPTYCLVVRHLVDYSSLDHFSLDDSSSSSSSESSSDSSADALSDSASSRSSSDHSLPTPSSDIRPSHYLCSLVPSVHHSSAISERPSHDSSSASLSCKRSRSPVAFLPLSSPTLSALEAGLGVDFEDDSSEPFRSRRTDLEMDVDVERSDEIEIDPEVQAEIDECFAYAYALRDIGIDARVEGAVEVTYETLGDLVQRFHDHTGEILVHHIQVIESVQKDQGHRIIVMGQHSADMLERIREMERDNKSLRETMPNTRSRASRTREGVNEQSDGRMTKALRVRDAVRNLGPLMGDEGEQEVNGNKGNGNGGNGNGNRNGGEYGYNFRGFIIGSLDHSMDEITRSMAMKD
ncbi:hypothetical protein Tco_0196564, partial [Tanacetum coccineum]